MPHPANDIAPSGRLPHMGLVRFAGPDAGSFLQGQISNDTRRLSAGSPLLAAYSTPQGRVVAVLHLLPHSTGLVALVPRDIVLPMIERLRKYVLRARVQIEDLSERFAVFGRYAADATAELPMPDSANGYLERSGIGVARVAADSNRQWVIGSVQDLAQHGLIANAGAAPPAPPAPRVEQAWRLADIRCGMPQIYAATREMFVAQMLNLDLIDGISFTKGCFTGQEIVARTQHLGRIKRRLFRLRLPAGSWAIGQAVHLTDGRSGRLTEVVQVGSGAESLAVLNMEPGSAGTGSGEDDHAGGSAGALLEATELPLPYPLRAQEGA